MNWRTRSKIRYWTSRWPLAGLFNRLPWTCWCDLVSWAMAKDSPKAERKVLLFGDGLDRYPVLRDCDARKRCGTGEDFDRNGSCYCGKFQTPEVEQIRQAARDE